MERPRLRWALAAPRYWPLWLGFALLFSLTQLLPLRAQHALGRLLGKLMRRTMRSRVAVTRRNLQLCFPEMSEAAREALLEQSFASAGIAVFETAIAWWWPTWRLRRILQFKGFAQLPQDCDASTGAVFISLHFFTLEIGARSFCIDYEGIGFYRPNNNPLVEYFQHNGRRQGKCDLIDKRDIKGAVKALRSGKRVWYAPDQDYGRNNCEFVSFFAVPDCPTINATSTLAKLGRAKVYLFTQTRLPKGQGYRLELSEPLDDFPGPDLHTDTQRISHLIEQEILKQPEQYMWLHRRFKTRPQGAPSYY